MCWETGHAEDMSYVDDTYARVLAMVSRLCMPQSKIHVHHGISSSRPQMYELVRAVILTSLDFQWRNGFGTHNFQQVAVGDVIGHSPEVGDVVSDVDGVIVFPKARSLWQVGKPVCYLASRR